jgi:putative sterol carrier protein
MLAELTEKVSAIVEKKAAVGFNIKFDLGDDGIILVQGEEAPNRVTNEDGAAATTIIMSAENFAAMMSGELSSMNAFMSGKLRIEGSMEKAMQLGSLFS